MQRMEKPTKENNLILERLEKREERRKESIEKSPTLSKRFDRIFNKYNDKERAKRGRNLQ